MDDVDVGFTKKDARSEIGANRSRRFKFRT